MPQNCANLAKPPLGVCAGCPNPHNFKIKGVTNLFIRERKVGQMHVLACLLVGEWFYISAESVGNSEIVAKVHISSGEFKRLNVR